MTPSQPSVAEEDVPWGRLVSALCRDVCQVTLPLTWQEWVLQACQGHLEHCRVMV